MEPIELQRLVDGELELEETRRLLRWADSDPASWRIIATTFIENRIWQTEFVDEAQEWTVPTAQPDEMNYTVNPGLPSPRMWWMSLAASTVLALSVGFLIGQRGGDSTIADGGPVAIAESGRDADAFGKDPASSASDLAERQGKGLDLNPAVYHMQLEDNQGNQYLDSEIPLYAAKQNDNLSLLRDSEIPDSLREQVTDSGYQLQQDIRYVSGRLNDGRQFVIPIRNYRFSPNQ